MNDIVIMAVTKRFEHLAKIMTTEIEKENGMSEMQMIEKTMNVSVELPCHSFTINKTSCSTFNNFYTQVGTLHSAMSQFVVSYFYI